MTLLSDARWRPGAGVAQLSLRGKGWLLAGLLLATACNPSTRSTRETVPSGPSVPTPSATSPGTWEDGMVLRGLVTIPAGTTVTLAKGAALIAAKGAQLVVAGTFLAPSGGRITGAGITIARGGKTVLSGLQLSGGGISTQTGALPSSLSHGSITKADTPVDVAVGTSLGLTDVRVEQVTGAALVSGTLVGSRVRYDKGGNTGIVVNKGAVLRLSDSLLFGNGEYDGDMITTDEAKELTVSTTEVRGVHCAFHLVGVGRLALDTLSLHDNAYGFMAYGSDPGTSHTIRNTDVFRNRDFGLFETPGVEQGPIVIDGGYWGESSSGDITQVSGKITRLHPATAPRV